MKDMATFISHKGLTIKNWLYKNTIAPSTATFLFYIPSATVYKTIPACVSLDRHPKQPLTKI